MDIWDSNFSRIRGFANTILFGQWGRQIIDFESPDGTFLIPRKLVLQVMSFLLPSRPGEQSTDPLWVLWNHEVLRSCGAPDVQLASPSLDISVVAVSTPTMVAACDGLHPRRYGREEMFVLPPEKLFRHAMHTCGDPASLPVPGCRMEVFVYTDSEELLECAMRNADRFSRFCDS